MVEYKYFKVFFLLCVLVILLSGCIDIKATHDLSRDVNGPHFMKLEAEVYSDDLAGEVHRGIRKLDCNFNSEEKEITEDRRLLTFTSDDCMVSKRYVSLNKDGGEFMYVLDSRIVKLFDDDNEYTTIPDITYIVNVPGFVMDTNGVKSGKDSVKFYITEEDVDAGYEFYVKYRLGCDNNQDCRENEYCSGGECLTLNCVSCAYVEDHSCKSYDCCSDDMCSDNKQCESNKCVDIPCECGVISSHMCMKYECCLDSDCGLDMFCKGNSCYEIKCRGNQECLENQECKQYNCLDISCKTDEVVKNHKCEKLICGFLQKSENHTCKYNMLIILVLLAIVVLIAFLVLAGGGILAHLHLKNK